MVFNDGNDITDGTTNTYIKELRATYGSHDDGNAAVLYWTGIFGKEYVGGDNLSIRFYDDFDDAMGPYISNSVLI